VWGERDNRLRRLGLRELGKYGLATLAAVSPARIVKPDPGREVRPAVPAPFLDEVQVVEVPDDVALAAIVHPVFCREQPPVGREGQAVRIPKAPGDDL
jgi:hypothetical protein